MLLLYNAQPISIYLVNRENRIGINFCNVKMKMTPCQFQLFHNYLTNISQSLKESQEKVQLLLVKNNLSITISLNHFLQLLDGVQLVMSERFGKKLYKQ
ncbi:MAG: hypothetical protein CMG74_09260 [Candidatus Marinimicrobia bacterium]|nr:hypothetical protein [Candidatus Neomarinimicrobiota bacterium]